MSPGKNAAARRALLAECNRLDLDQRACRQCRDLDGRARRRLACECLAVDGIDTAKIRHVLKKNRRLDDLVQRAAGRAQDGLQVGQDLADLGFDALDELAGARVNADLAGGEDELAGLDALRIRSERGRGRWCVDNLSSHDDRSTFGSKIGPVFGNRTDLI